MAQSQVIEGTGKELAQYLNKQPEQRFRLVLLSEKEEKVEQAARKELTPEEKIQALNALAEKNRGLPVLPPEAFERESIYPRGRLRRYRSSERVEKICSILCPGE